MTDGTIPGSIPEGTDPWQALLEDAATIESEFQTAGWDTVFLEPTAIESIERAERVGFRAVVSGEAFETVKTLLDRVGVSFDAVDVYYQTAGQTTVVLAVERDDESEHAVLIPLYYEAPDVSDMFEIAFEVDQLHVSLEPDSDDGSGDDGDVIVFSHEDPSLFLENMDTLEE